jgi:antitoxin component of RelBE/YafQ-DinJ toxin-antitoxin module
MGYNIKKRTFERVRIMTRIETIQINVDEAVWENAEAAFSMAGITVSEAVNNFLKQVPPPPERVVVRSDEELLAKLEQAEKGGYMSLEDFRERLNKKHGLQL